MGYQQYDGHQPYSHVDGIHQGHDSVLEARTARSGDVTTPWMYGLLTSVSAVRTSLVLTAAGLCIAVLAVIDYFIYPESSVLLLSLVPLTLVTWSAGRNAGMVFAIFANVLWYLAHILSGHTLRHSALQHAWDGLSRLGVFLFVILLLDSLKQLMERETRLAHTDFLTGAVNGRAFYALASAELERLRRYGRPFTVAYLDIDDFKAINDVMGHTAGDMLLQTVARTIADTLRSIDTLARLGGDEFAILLPHTDAHAANAAMARLQQHLTTAMHQQQVPVTFSVGSVTYAAAPPTMDDLVRVADEVMYTVKKHQKNAIQHAVYARPSADSPATWEPYAPALPPEER